MTTLEREIIEKFNQLDDAGKKRIRDAIIEHDVENTHSFDFDKWSAEIQLIREDIVQHHGGEFPHIDAIDMLRSIRDGEDE